MSVKVGDRLFAKGAPVRVMAVAEGYAMVRKLRAMPFVIPVKNLIRETMAEALRRTDPNPGESAHD